MKQAVPSTISFRNIPHNFLENIKNKTIINLYSRFIFLYFTFRRYNEQERKNNQESIENLLFHSLKDFKFMTIYLCNNNQNKQAFFINNKTKSDKELEDKSIPIIVNAFFCADEKFLIIEQINLSTIKSLINKLQDREITVLNTSPKFDTLEKTSSEKQMKEEISNFCHEFQSEINQNVFVKATISPVAGFIIRRFLYPSHYFKDSSFFNLYDENKKKEENKKTKLSKLFTCTNVVQYVYQLFQFIQEMNSIEEEKDNKLEEAEFKYEDFIKLRLINTNEAGKYYLVIHRENFHIFMMKDLWNANEPKREIDFCKKYSHRCFTRFYGFIKEKKSVKAIIYEYMTNGTLKENKDKIDPIFSLITIDRLFEGLEYLYSKR